MELLHGLDLWGRYHRKEVADSLGAKYSRYWQQGVVRVERDYLLFVTLDKSDRPAEHRYDDRFLNASEFHWQSQNQESRAKRGEKYLNRGTPDLRFHLFVRKSSRDADNHTVRFTYLGVVRFHSWSGDNPISIQWTLEKPISPELAVLFGSNLPA